MANQDRRELAQGRLIAASAALAGLAVMLGAFGVHVLKARLGPQALGWWETATQYAMWHALAALALSLSGRAWTRLPVQLLLAGSLVFSFSLYAMALGGPLWLGAVTPLGGLSLISGWTLLAWRALRAPD